MALYNKDSRLADAIMAHPSLIPVVSRLGIRLGMGDATFESVCSESGIAEDFCLSVVNTFLDEDYFPSDPSGSFSLEKTADYLRKTNMFYLRVQLPNIDRHFNSLIERSGADNNLGLLRKFYQGMKTQLTDCLRYDEEVLFPALAASSASSEDFSPGYSEVEEKLHDLLLFFVKHLKGDYDLNLCTAVISAVFSLEKDVCQNNRIRTRIFLPLIENLEKH